MLFQKKIELNPTLFVVARTPQTLRNIARPIKKGRKLHCQCCRSLVKKNIYVLKILYVLKKRRLKMDVVPLPAQIFSEIFCVR